MTNHMHPTTARLTIREQREAASEATRARYALSMLTANEPTTVRPTARKVVALQRSAALHYAMARDEASR